MKSLKQPTRTKGGGIMNHFMDFDPHLIRERNEKMRQEVRTVRLEEALRENGGQEKKEKRMRNALSKVMLVGRATVFMVGLAVTLALLLGAATTALGATGATAFMLGKLNSATATTSLVSTISEVTQPALSVTNKGGGPALSLGTLSGKAPIEVNAAAGTATNLSADKLDGKDSTEFLGKNEKAADASHADSAEHATTAESATNASSAGNADTLDGKNSTDFVSGTGSMTIVDERFSDPDGSGSGRGYSRVLSVPGAQIQAACAEGGGTQVTVNRTSDVNAVVLWRDDGGADPIAKTLYSGPSDPTTDTDSSPLSTADRVIWQGSSSAGTFTAVLFARYEKGARCAFSGYVSSAPKAAASGPGWDLATNNP
jgi:hypothetical protein